jgi:hypothetical protein
VCVIILLSKDIYIRGNVDRFGLLLKPVWRTAFTIQTICELTSFPLFTFPLIVCSIVALRLTRPVVIRLSSVIPHFCSHCFVKVSFHYAVRVCMLFKSYYYIVTVKEERGIVNWGEFFSYWELLEIVAEARLLNRL